MSDTSNNYGGMSFSSVLAIVFIVLKLLKVITWSWWWVLAPIWIWFVIAAVILVFAFIVACLSR